MNTMPMSMARSMAMPAALLLAACTPTATDAARATPGANAASVPASSPVAQVEATSSQSTDVLAAKPTNASISGAIREGNRSPPALRVCASPVGGGTPTCIDTPEGAREYRIDVAPGRYYLLGWVQSGELTLIAHASQIRCIRAPCPPDALIEVSVAPGQQRTGIDLSGGYVDIPDGWPKRPG